MIFSNILGHARAKHGLSSALATGRIHHAWLFSGREGIGKRMLALRFAQALSCEEGRPGHGLDALAVCERCRHCTRIAQGLHPDLEIVAPEGKTLKIKQIRDLQKKVAFKPFEAPWRVVLIEDAHRLHEAAANALLKTLEEPTPGTLFVVLTDQPHRLLPTIISRCQPLRLAAFSPQELLAFLIARDVPVERAQLVSVLAQGSLARALTLRDSDTLDALLEYIDALRDIQARGVRPAMLLAERLARSKELIPSALTILRAYFRDLMLVLAGLDDRVSLHTQRDALRIDARGYDIARVAAIVDAVAEAERAIEGNVHAQLALETLFLEVAALQRSPERLRPRHRYP